jgi:peroxiredoxin
MRDRGKKKLAVAMIALVAILGGAHATRAEMAELLKKLSLSGYAPSTKPPNFTGRTADGQTVSLALLRGKVILLNFWATWCEECRPEMPVFQQLNREFAARGLVVVGVNAREGPEVIRRYAKELGLTFPLVLDSNGEINQAYGVIGLPTTFFIARDGRAVALAIGPRDWSGAAAKTMVRTLLAE